MTNIRLSASNRLKIVVFHGPEENARYELLAWLRGPDVEAEAITVDELPPHSCGSIDDKVNAAIAWADKAIALVTPEKRSPSGAPNVIDEIGRIRDRRPKDLAILRNRNCEDIWSNLAGVTRIEYTDRVSEKFIDLLRFFGMTPGSSLGVSRQLQAIPLRTVLSDWKTPLNSQLPPIFIVVGGSEKYDPDRKKLGIKDYQSTEPVLGIVRLARALSEAMRDRFVDAVCDYSSKIRSSTNEIDVVLVGAGDTNRLTKEVFVQDVSLLPARFEPPTGSDTIFSTEGGEVWSKPDEGMVLALDRPFKHVRYAIVCAGNGAKGTNGSLTWVASCLRRQVNQFKKLGDHTAVIVRAPEDAIPTVLWPIVNDDV